MTISSSLNSGVSGLTANATKLATISDNIANSATYGYKRSTVDFSSMVLQQSASTYAAGGVSTTTSKNIAETGSLTGTGNATDIAVSGSGLIPVTDGSGVDSLASERDLMFVTTGSFYADADGNLRTSSGLYLLGWETDETGDTGTVSRTSGSDLTTVNINTASYYAAPTENIALGINLPAEATEAGASGEAYELPVEYFDNLGSSKNMNYVFTPVVGTDGSSNESTVEIYDEAGDPDTVIGTLQLTFSDDAEDGGTLASVTAADGANYDEESGTVSISLAHGDVDVYIGSLGATDGIQQLAADFSPTNVTKDGAAIGELQSVEVNEGGQVVAVYDSGYTSTLYQIPVGDVANVNGLSALDGQAYALSSTSGSLYLWDAGTGPVGEIAGYSLMESTTDIASELTDLIETQRSYSSNAKIIQTVDEMLQETTNLKR